MTRPAWSLSSSYALGSDRSLGNRFPALGYGMWGMALNAVHGPLCGDVHVHMPARSGMQAREPTRAGV